MSPEDEMAKWKKSKEFGNSEALIMTCIKYQGS